MNAPAVAVIAMKRPLFDGLSATDLLYFALWVALIKEPSE